MQVRRGRTPFRDEAFEDIGGLKSAGVCATHLSQYPSASLGAVPSVLGSPTVNVGVGGDEGEEMSRRSRECELGGADRRVPKAGTLLVQLEESDDPCRGGSTPLDGGFILRKGTVEKDGAEVEIGVHPRRQYDVSKS